jgi:hypothetical protein
MRRTATGEEVWQNKSGEQVAPATGSRPGKEVRPEDRGIFKPD